MCPPGQEKIDWRVVSAGKVFPTRNIGLLKVIFISNMEATDSNISFRMQGRPLPGTHRPPIDPNGIFTRERLVEKGRAAVESPAFYRNISYGFRDRA
jgi:hypothetical protein